ncbi:MAG: FeoB-associated Cys-rich membrane protein [bacterium]|nr:FeoB-associated Cys-rich membrane protein [bacterium]MDD6226011.1 FeoB-associated Cys-rich membrane protein [bacterium]
MIATIIIGVLAVLFVGLAVYSCVKKKGNSCSGCCKNCGCTYCKNSIENSEDESK